MVQSEQQPHVVELLKAHHEQDNGVPNDGRYKEPLIQKYFLEKLTQAC